MRRLSGILENRRLKYALIIASLLFAICFLFYLACLNYTEPTEIGISRNAISGEMMLQEGGGWYRTAPWVRVSKIDIRPMRVGVSTAGRGFSAKLVQFDPKGWQEFVKTEGFRYWWWANFFSFNFGYDEEYRGMKDIMRGYAYSVKRYPFITILEEYQER